MPSYKILIVEDQPFQREYLKNLFFDAGQNDIHTAECGQDALNSLRKKTFDLVLCDLLMPGLDGVQLIQKLAELDIRTNLALMSSTSKRVMNGVCLVAKMHGLPVIDQIAKPAMPDSIRRLIAKLENRPPLPVRDQLPVYDFSLEDIQQAMLNDEIQAWFQPKKSLADGSIAAAEALVRWVHPQKGILQPSQFLPALNRWQLGKELLLLMLRHTVEAQAYWEEKGYRVPVSINLPTQLLNDVELPDLLHERVRQLGGVPGNICFELSEGIMTEKLSDFYACACRLRMKGFNLAQDDFGQCYSSFYNLLCTPFTELKLDHALITDSVEDRSMTLALQCMVILGRKLGLNVVAEGVENQEQLALLRKFNCHTAQGFLISQALSPQLFADLLREDNPLPSH